MTQYRIPKIVWVDVPVPVQPVVVKCPPDVTYARPLRSPEPQGFCSDPDQHEYGSGEQYPDGP